MAPSSELTVAPEAVQTPLGDARLWWHAARGPTRALLVLGHGAGRGVDTADLLALADGLPASGVAVALLDQPWVVAGRKVADAPARLDAGFLAAVPQVQARLGQHVPLVVGGRSAGARVACRTASALGAMGAAALAFPLHPPGRPDRSRIDELAGSAVPTIVVQGERDPFGAPAEIRAALAGRGRTPSAGTEVVVVEVPWADHSLRVPARAPVTPQATLDTVVHQLTGWLGGLVAP